MKKQFCILLFLCLICLPAAGCAKHEPSQADMQESLPAAGHADAGRSETQGNAADDVAVDVDLTVLSSTMAYAEVYNIMMNPDSYVEKIIRGIGVYHNFYYEEMDRTFHYFIVLDATGCCPQGLDFVWNGEHVYPDDYPKIGESIEVTGVFVKGEVEGQPYYYVAVDDISVPE